MLRIDSPDLKQIKSVIYNTMEFLASYGKFKAWLGVFVAFVIASSLFALGISILRTKDRFKNKTTARVTSVEQASGMVDVNVTVNGVEYPFRYYSSPPPSVGSSVDIYYTNDNPPVFSNADEPPKTMGAVLMSVGLSIVLFSLVIAYFVSQSKNVAKVYGGVQLFGNITR